MDCDRLVVIEFCDTRSDEGVYRKYSIFRIGDRLLPHHLVFSRGWNLKSYDLTAPEHIEEERRFLATNPHADWVHEVFTIARIDFGRLDYGVASGRPQAWEINTNPMLTLTPGAYPVSVLDARNEFAHQLGDVLDAIDTPGLGVELALAFEPSLRHRMAEAGAAREAELAAQRGNVRGWRRWIRRARVLARAWYPAAR